MTARILTMRPRPENNLSDAELVEKCSTGDERALRTLYDRHHRCIYRFISRLVGYRAHDLDDLVQAVFLTAWKKATDYHPTSPVKSWLFGIAFNQVRDRRRAHRRFLRAIASLNHRGRTEGPSLEARVSNRQLVDRVAEALEQLPHDLRVTYVLCEVEDVSGTEAAQIMNVAPGTAWRRLHEARKRLRNLLKEQMP